MLTPFVLPLYKIWTSFSAFFSDNFSNSSKLNDTFSKAADLLYQLTIFREVCNVMSIFSLGRTNFLEFFF